MFSKLQNKINIETLTENHSLNETLRETCHVVARIM